MIVVSNRIQVAQGHEKEFEQRFEGRARNLEHCVWLRQATRMLPRSAA